MSTAEEIQMTPERKAMLDEFISKTEPRKSRFDALAPVMVDASVVQVAKERLRPIIQRYWMRQGKMSLEDLCVSSYMQAVNDLVDGGFVLPNNDSTRNCG